MYCTKCGKELKEGALRCEFCNEIVESDHVTVEDIKDFVGIKKEVYTEEKNQSNVNPSMGLPIKNYKPYLDYNPIGMWGYFFYGLLFNIPVIGQILLLLFSFGITKNVNLRNFARSWFCVYIIMIVIVLLAVAGIIAISF